MCRLLVVAAAVFGLLAVMGVDAQECNMTAVDEAVEIIQVQLLTILQNASIGNAEKVEHILNAVCNQGNIRTEVDNISLIVATCQSEGNLNISTNLASLNIGPLKFTDLLKNFQGVVNFCECVPALLHVMSVESLVPELKIQTDNDYPVMNVSLLCDNTTDAAVLKEAVMYIDSKLLTCPAVFEYSNVLSVENVGELKMFAQESCPNFNDTVFTCAVENATETAFKECITTANINGTAEEKRCKRHECVTEHVSCAGARSWYIQAVNMLEKNTFASTVCTTDSATSIVASVTLILATLCSKMLF